ncbi:prenyltransferase [Tetragenococcus koreensis]|uniref:1,4-dihydroxy-2-naphthoate octaprenyltransferase n=1 Tax=Tetragenococcus koreensis TaxID=290335 RepID=A0AAN4UBX9_9ENTE|nr:prenyltransferase [Tetragenococcus koreensis]AYW46012.1 1,4-dihydroxy-2-naphthoate polyprenyltransferase [Tetragenococcus koreensis]MCF1584672.1 prenyltransferase [Tetragenococcus koreensis]MCF1614298.1 prenyltransferase [Tetragenococcus koreensis]MCF1616475.1 prenyltransferase [Tetragenococcus koreensis]MCF1619647.1 prenyltransferase [Tetragenococcus koreensis]
MSVAVFLELVEMKAKTASVLPFLIGLCYSWYHYGTIHVGYVAIYFVAMFIFNMAVDILDNYNDYRHAREGHDYKEKTNIIGRENLSLRLVFWLMVTMITVSALIGIALASVVGWPLLWMGLFCYLVGIFYSSGPRPLSSLPVGEISSGITMGFMISLICVYINTFEAFQWSFSAILGIVVIALPNTMWIANLMLANNTCDKEEDEKNGRYTLVHYIGKTNALRLFVGMNGIAFVAILASFLLGLAPWTVLLSFLALPFVYGQVKLFLQEQVKSKTFRCAVKILAVGSIVQFITYAIGIFIS